MDGNDFDVLVWVGRPSGNAHRIVNLRRYLSTTACAAVTALLVLIGAGSASAVDPVPGEVRVAGVGSGPDGAVSLVAAVTPGAAPSLRVSTDDGVPVPASVEPVLSGRTPVQLVVDAGSVSANELLRQLPTGAPAGVVTASAGGLDSAIGSALRRLSGTASVLAVVTSSPDAGREAADSLAARLRRAGAVLAVVTTSPSPYWQDVASSTGGVIVPAADGLVPALQNRYRVTFARPDGDAAQVQVGGGAAARFALPPAPVPRERIWWVLGSVELAGVLVLAIVLLVRRRGRKLDDLVEDVVPVDPMPGVRVFDVSAFGGPLDVTHSLYEPRTVRDAREVGTDLPARPPRARQSTSPPPPEPWPLPGGPRHGPAHPRP